MAKVKKKKATRLGARKAIQRLDDMLPLLERDVGAAIRMHAMWSAGNSVVGELELHGTSGSRAYAYETLQLSLVNSLALTLAKLYELPRPKKWQSPSARHNASDVASIPLMIRLLKQTQCRKALLERARLWTPHIMSLAPSHLRLCEEKIDSAIERFALLRRRKRDQLAMIKLKNTRDRAIAHTLLLDRRVAKAPTYRAAFLQLIFAKGICEDAAMAIGGSEKKLGAGYRRTMDSFRDFWRAALSIPDHVPAEISELENVMETAE
jgi:hypothetical protein